MSCHLVFDFTCPSFDNLTVNQTLRKRKSSKMDIKKWLTRLSHSTFGSWFCLLLPGIEKSDFQQ